jgi:hypothetical protein
MIMSARYPLNSLLLNESTKQTSIDSTTRNGLSLVSTVRVVVIEIDVFGERDVDKQESFAFGWVAQLNVEVLLAEPLHLVWMHAAPPLLIKTVLVTSV